MEGVTVKGGEATGRRGSAAQSLRLTLPGTGRSATPNHLSYEKAESRSVGYAPTGALRLLAAGS